MRNKELSDDSSAGEIKCRNWLRERYEHAWYLMLDTINYGSPQECSQALVSCMNMMAVEAKYHSPNKTIRFPRHRLRCILEKLLSVQQAQKEVLKSFVRYFKYLDVAQSCWKILSDFNKKLALANEATALNFLHILQNLPITTELGEGNQLLCPGTELFSYSNTRVCINKIWNNLMTWLDSESPESLHKQTLIVLLENIFPHLENPVLLTDFLMDSLDCGK